MSAVFASRPVIATEFGFGYPNGFSSIPPSPPLLPPLPVPSNWLMELIFAHVTFSPMRPRVMVVPCRCDSGTKRTRVPEIWLAFTFSAASTPLPVEMQV